MATEADESKRLAVRNSKAADVLERATIAARLSYIIKCFPTLLILAVFAKQSVKLTTKRLPLAEYLPLVEETTIAFRYYRIHQCDKGRDQHRHFHSMP